MQITEEEARAILSIKDRYQIQALLKLKNIESGGVCAIGPCEISEDDHYAEINCEVCGGCYCEGSGVYYTAGGDRDILASTICGGCLLDEFHEAVADGGFLTE